MGEPASKKRRLSPIASSGQAPIPGFANWDLERDYEQRMRRKTKDDKLDKLMIKTTDGHVRDNPRMYNDEVGDQDGSDLESLSPEREDEYKRTDSAQDTTRKRPPKSALPVKEQVLKAKEEMARIASSVSENPEDNVGNLASLSELAESRIIAIKKLALVTQLAVYKDIVPGYRIRPMSKDDLQGKISKDVKKLRQFEQSLLGGYKNYVQSLAKLASGRLDPSMPQKDIATLVSVAISCACNLLINLSHFNCRPELITILVQRLMMRNVNADFLKCQETLEQLFQQDEDGHASLDAVGQLTKSMKVKQYAIHENVLGTFLHLRLLNEFAHKASTETVDRNEAEEPQVKKTKAKREFRTKRERKVMREQKSVEKEMREADASVSYEERDKNQAETLKLVFVAYFRILKEKIDHLMGAVLEGLARYSHLINQDFFGDILEALKDLINDAENALQTSKAEQDADTEDNVFDTDTERNATRESLLCIITAFALLQGQQDVAKSANALHLDLQFFITHLYQILIPLSVDANLELGTKSAHVVDPNGLQVPAPASRDRKVNVATTIVLLLRSLQSALLPPTALRAVPPNRVAAFTKQLMTLAMHLPPKSCLSVLELLRHVSKSHGARIAALWHTDERRGDGVFNALSQEVESSNPFASTIWEGELLRHHFDPKVRDSVSMIEKNIRAART